MDIWDNNLMPCGSLIEALSFDLGQKQMVSLVGAGGKTSLAMQLAKELVQKKQKTIVTTTTHMFQPKHFGVLDGTVEQVKQQLEKDGIAVVGSTADNRKMTKVPGDMLLACSQISDMMIVEADGAKRLPLKAPNQTEPVIPEQTTHLLVVAGLSALSKPIEQVCHRIEVVCQLLQTHPQHKITKRDIAKIMKKGYCEPNRNQSITVVLNQADDWDKQQQAKQIAQYLTEIPVIITCCLSEGNGKYV